MSEALRAVRNSLGPDALILETKNVPYNNGVAVEITAVADEMETEEASDRGGSMPERFSPEPMEMIRQEIAALRSMLAWLAPGLTHQSEILKHLVMQGLSPEIIALLTEAMKQAEGADDRERVYRALSRLIPSGGQLKDDGGRDSLALFGPTGVGKTTTVVKLTVFETQRRSCRVGWVSTENRRVAGNDPLAVYASILGVRYETAENQKELKRAMDRLADCDLLLIDTPGISPRDAEGMERLAKLFRGISNLQRTLLLSAVTNGSDMADWVNIYRRIGLDSLLFTKLDECRYFGPLINTAVSGGRPVSYVTLGQNIAGDLEIAKPLVLASLLFSGVHPDD